MVLFIKLLIELSAATKPQCYNKIPLEL